MKTRAIEDKGFKTEAEQTAEEVEEVIEESLSMDPIFMRPILLEVTRQYPGQSEPETKSETVVIRDFHVPPAEVGVGLGLTLQLRPYESARIDVSVRVPCYAAEMEGAYEFAKRFVHERLDAERDAVREWSKRSSKSDDHAF